jgi:DNA invertase Pin-like site-specific DNA recombinase
MNKPKDSRKKRKANHKPNRCAIYARCATDPTSASNSIAKQIRFCIEYAEQKQWDVVKEFVRVDLAVSGGSLARRKELRSLMEAAEKRPRTFDRVLIADMSRLARNLDHFLQIMNHFKINGVDVTTIKEGFIWPEHRTHLILGDGRTVFIGVEKKGSRQ